MRGQRRKLVRRRLERQPRVLRDLFRHPLRKLAMRIQSRADRRAANRQLEHVRHRRFDPLQVVVELRDVAREFLAERQRHRIHQMRASDLHDALEILGLARQRVAQLSHRRNQVVRHFFRRRDMHRGRERVVRRLRHVHVVVRMNRLLAAEHAARHLDRAIRDYLVGVHVGLRAAAGLPDAQRKMFVEFARDNLVRRRGDQLGLLRRQFLQIAINFGRRLLQQPERAYHRPRHPIESDREMQQRPLRLRPPVAIVRDLDRSHAVSLDALAARRHFHGRGRRGIHRALGAAGLAHLRFGL